jgi:hypothetical protein
MQEKTMIQRDSVCIADSKLVYHAIDAAHAELTASRSKYLADKRYLKSLQRDKRKLERNYRDYTMIKTLAEQDPESLLLAVRQGLVKITSIARLSWYADFCKYPTE